ncbi:uncharacterized protein LOC142622949 [Castanea sativa]|uniref:uncharacterized protein LOC142622949 n=1 Tax=Castanea sativa TaxID=21020 RepID=UPI003F64B840
MSSGGLGSAAASLQSCFSPTTRRCSSYSYAPTSLIPRTLSSPNLKLKGLRFSGPKGNRIYSNSSNRPGGADGGSASGDSDSRGVLDAFFLGKALAEALNERIESTVGEFLSAVGRLQAEQQKQVQDFQEDVLERAKKAKEKAAREAMEAQGLIPKSTVVDTPATDSVDSVTASSTVSEISAADPSSLSSSTTPMSQSYRGPADKQEPALGVSNDD